jgi:Domain of unknown function (DUF4386)
MNARDNRPRYLGAAFLVVVLTSLVSGAAADSATGSGSVAQVLARVAGRTGLLHFATLAGLVNAVGILVLAGLLVAVLGGWGKVPAAVAALCWAGESFFYALDQIASTALAQVASDYRGSGGASGQDAAQYESLGKFLFTDVHPLDGTILMFFYCAGGLLFYSLFFRSRLIPRWISGYGVVAVAVGIVGASIELLGHRLGLVPYIAIGPFEIIIGLYLLTRRTQRDHLSQESLP